MDWLIPAIVATLSATLILALVYAFLYLHERRMALGLWTLAWIFSCFRYIVELGLNDSRNGALYILGMQLFGLLTGVFLIWGCFAWVQRRLPVAWIIVAGLCSAWIVGGVVAGVNPLWITYPTFFFTGAIFLVNGILFIRTREMVGVGRWIVGVAFILWGLHKFDFPMLREMAWFAPWGYLLSSSLSITVAVGLLLAHFERDQGILRQSQSQIQGLLDATQETLVMVDRDGVILACNETAARRLGKSVAEMVGHNVYSFLPEPLASSRRQQLEKVFRLGRPVEFEDQRDGHIFWSFIGPVYNPDGSVRAVSIFAEDITRRRRAETERNRLFTYSVDLLCIGGFDGFFKELNPAWTQTLGWSQTDLKSRPWIDFVHPNDQAATVEAGKRLAEGQTLLGFENRYRCKDGSWRWLSWNAFPLLDQDQIFSVARDVTESQRVHDALRQSEQNLREAQRIAHIGSWTYSISDDRVAWSDELYRIFGLSPDHGPVSAEQLYACIHPDDRAEFRRQVQARLPNRTDYRIVLPDGTVKIIHEELRIENDAQGRPAFLRGTAQDVTEQRNAEKALIHSHDLMRYIIEHNRSAVAVHDRDLRYIYVSQRYLDDYKVKEKDVIGKHHYEVFPDLPQKWRDVHQRALAGEVCSAEDDPYVRQDGTTDWTRWECRPWYQADGTIGGIIIYTEVITARKQAEEELRISGEKFSKMFRLSPEMASLTRISDGVLLDVNESFERIMGFSRDEAIGHSSAELGIWTDPEDRPRMLRILKEKRVVHLYEVHLRRKDKQIITALFSMNPIEIHGEQVALTMVTDITERKRAEEELHESRRRLATLMSNLPGIAYRCRNNRDWTMEFISDGCMALTEYPASDLCGNAKLSYNDIIVPEDREMVWDAVQKALSEYQSYQVTYRIRAANGSVKWVWEQGTGVFDVQGNLEALEGFVSDMTARVLAEQQREQLLRDLQAKTDELESIIYVSSHDLRSPLVNIQGFSGELGESCRQVRKLLSGDAVPESDHRQLEELLGREIPAALEYITTSVSKLDALQKGLLKICRIGRETLEIGPVVMNDLIDGILKSTRYQLDNCQAQVTVDPLPNCLADAGQLTQVFTNLIDNAVKYRSPDRTLVIRIYGRVEGHQCVYAVADNGVGIAPEHQQKVFEMFHQLDPLHGPGGEGLGLTIVKRILGRMDGQVRLESAPGVGSVFFVHLPKA